MNYDEIDFSEMTFETFKSKYINEYKFDFNFIKEIIDVCESFVKKGEFTSYHPVYHLSTNPAYLKITKKIALKITKDFKLMCDPNDVWFQFYKEHDVHGIHSHGNDVTSGILYLNDIGGTEFLNPNYYQFLFKNFKALQDINTELFAKFTINSEAGKLITFPGWLLHSVDQHKQKDKIRYISSFNVKTPFVKI